MPTSLRALCASLLIVALMPVVAAGSTPGTAGERDLSAVTASLDRIGERTTALERDTEAARRVSAVAPPPLRDEHARLVAGLDAVRGMLIGLHWTTVNAILARVEALHRRLADVGRLLADWEPYTPPPVPTPTVPEHPGTGSVTGSVVDEVTRLPLAAVVYIHSEDPYSYSAWTETDPSGGFAFTGLWAGTYHVAACAEGYHSEAWRNIPGDDCNPYYYSSPTDIPVLDGQVTGGIDLDLAPPATLRGRVTADDGSALMYTYVSVWDASGYHIASAYTDGLYEFHLGAGTFFLSVQSDGFLSEVWDGLPCQSACTPTAGTPIQLVAGGVTTADVSLGRAGSISGALTDDSGAAISGYVSAYDERGAWLDSRSAYGAYSLPGLWSGAHFVRTYVSGYRDELYDDLPCEGGCDVTSGTAVWVELGRDTGGVDFELVSNEPPGGESGSIAGTVRESGSRFPVAALILVYDRQGNYAGNDYSDSFGEYRLDGLPVGEYGVVAVSGSHVDELFDDRPCQPACDPGLGDPVVVTADGVAQADFELDVSGMLQGSVTDAATLAPVSTVVRLFDEEGVEVASSYVYDRGHYQFTDLAGTYYVATNGSPNHVDELYEDVTCDPTCDPRGGRPVPVAAGTLTEVDFALRPMGSIAGTVVADATGQPIGWQRVILYGANGQWWNATDTDGTGRYVFPGLLAGTYFVMARESSYDASYRGELFDDLPCSPTCDPTGGTPVEVTFGERTGGIDFRLLRFSRIRGVVADSASNPLPNSTVVIYDSAGQQAATAGAWDGSYETRALRPGTYYARAESPGHASELWNEVPCPVGCDPTTGTPIQLTLDADVNGIDFSLGGDGWIEGTVTEEGTTTGLAAVGLVVILPDGSQLAAYSTVADGTYRVSLPPGDYRIRTSSAYRDELYADIPCDPTCDLAAGTVLTVDADAGVSGVDFALAPSGGIVGVVTDASTGLPVPGAWVNIFDAAGTPLPTTAYSEADGSYRYPDLVTGTYFVRAGSSRYQPELYDDIPCPDSCDPTTGQPVQVTTGLDSTASFALQRYGTIGGSVREEATGAPVTSGYVIIMTPDGTALDYAWLGAQGRFTSDPLRPGVYYARTYTYGYGLVDELYDDVRCDDSCNPASGTPILIDFAVDRTDVDFGLNHRGAITGTVIQRGTAEGVSTDVDLYDAAGSLLTTAWTYGGGFRFEAVMPGTYYLRTRNSRGFIDQVYDGVECEPSCDVTLGTPVLVEYNQSTTADFVLRKPYFADVPRDHVLRRWVEALYVDGVTSGCLDRPLRYCPAASVTRAQMAPFLLRSLEGPGYVPPAPTGLFADVPLDHPFAGWIEELANRQITLGCDVGLYCPGDPVYRQTMARFVLRTLEGAAWVPPPPEGIFADVPVDHPNAGYIEELYRRGVTSGCADAPLRFCPDATITRAQMAAFLVRAFSLPPAQ